MKQIVVLGLVALALAACAGDPVWDSSVFPPEPQYGMSSPAPAPVADVKK